ncbi:MAG: 2'-5' RNA ligase family protein [Gammaproteobacteria bacterium]|nr:2'-5' RNA ligase family protein [Gammaproteobacteria bacterium]
MPTTEMLLTSSNYPFSETLVAEQRDYVEWHRGRARYGVWIVPIECPELLEYIDCLTGQLGDLLHPSRRQPHITLFVCGFDQPHRVHDDDFTTEQLQQQVQALERLERSPCTLQIGAVDSFASAALLRVADPGGHLAYWRSALAPHCTEVRQTAYVPHLTLGLYRRSASADELRQRLATLSQVDRLTVPVSCLDYVTYSSFDMFGPLSREKRICWQ